MYTFADYYDPYGDEGIPPPPPTDDELRRRREEYWLAVQRQHLAEKKASQRASAAAPRTGNPFAPGGWANGDNAVNPRTATPAMAAWWASVQQNRPRPSQQSGGNPQPRMPLERPAEPHPGQPSPPKQLRANNRMQPQSYLHPLAMAANVAAEQNLLHTRMGDEVEDAIAKENESRVRQMREARRLEHEMAIERVRQETALAKIQAEREVAMRAEKARAEGATANDGILRRIQTDGRGGVYIS